MASSISHAREGKLYLMLAGDEATYQRVQTLIEQNQFDTIYHEHYSYLSLVAVEQVAHSLLVHKL